MKILCVGGGSGGHVTPIAAVIKQLQKPCYRDTLGDDVQIRVWCDRKFSQQAKQLMPNNRVDVIMAGKLRRYANLSWWYRWFSPWHIIHTHIPNLVDMFKIISGFLQSLIKLKIWRPDVVFCKGGYVSLPVGIVAHLYKIPLVIHDSDTIAGLTNRILSRYATFIGTGSPIENYPLYPKNKTRFIGVPVTVPDSKLTTKQKKTLANELKLDISKPIVLVTGGGLGAAALNKATLAIAPSLNKRHIQIVLISGTTHHIASTETNDQFICLSFTDKLLDYARLASVVVSRVGATTMAELAALAKPTIIIPSPYLAGDHQTKNAAVYQKAQASVVLDELAVDKNPLILEKAIIEIIDHPAIAKQLSQKLHDFAKKDALVEMTNMLVAAATNKQQ